MAKRHRDLPQPSRDQFPKYSITVTAALTGVTAQQLRRYEQSGLLIPHRSLGGTRQYSDVDLAQIAILLELTNAGINHAGIERILLLQAKVVALEERLTLIETPLADLDRSQGRHP